ncbi:MAG: hypothetical protein OXB88_06530 [Bacteriovoracales bacterium]|nr:hypothetical protein [Bacteriovoracales bacterium]
MRELIKLLLLGLYSLVLLEASKRTLAKVQMMALEKAVQGLGSLEKSTRLMTGGKLDF